MIIFSSFESYSLAEKTRIKYMGKPIVMTKPLDIDNGINGFEMIKIQRDNVLMVNPLRSLEEIKAIREILENLNWNIHAFDQYELFYMNGLYWELEFRGYKIYFKDKFVSVLIYH